MKDFLKRVLEELDFLNASKADIARFLNVRKSTVYSWFERDTIPAADTALRIADFLNVPLEYLITGERDKAQKAKTELSDFERNLLKEAAGLLPEDKTELMAYIAMKKSLYRALKADNGKMAIIKDC